MAYRLIYRYYVLWNNLMGSKQKDFYTKKSHLEKFSILKLVEHYVRELVKEHN